MKQFPKIVEGSAVIAYLCRDAAMAFSRHKDGAFSDSLPVLSCKAFRKDWLNIGCVAVALNS